MKKQTPKMEVIVDDDFEPVQNEKINLRIEGTLENTKSLIKFLEKSGLVFKYNKKAYKVPDSDPPRYYRYLNDVVEPIDDSEVVDDED